MAAIFAIERTNLRSYDRCILRLAHQIDKSPHCPQRQDTVAPLVVERGDAPTVAWMLGRNAIWADASDQEGLVSLTHVRRQSFCIVPVGARVST